MSPRTALTQNSILIARSLKGVACFLSLRKQGEEGGVPFAACQVRSGHPPPTPPQRPHTRVHLHSMHTHMQTYAYNHTHAHAHMQTRAHSYMKAHAFTHEDTCTQLHAHIDTCTHTFTHVHTNMDTRRHMHTIARTYTHADRCTHTCTHVCARTYWAAARSFNAAWAHFLDLKVKEEGHHICKKKSGSVGPSQRLLPEPGTCSHSTRPPSRSRPNPCWRPGKEQVPSALGPHTTTLLAQCGHRLRSCQAVRRASCTSTVSSSAPCTWGPTPGRHPQGSTPLPFLQYGPGSSLAYPASGQGV